MKETILELLATANQVFSFVVNENTIRLAIRTYKKICYCSVYVNDELVEAGRKALPNTTIFPKPTNAEVGGEFMFKTKTDEYPHYSGFEDGKFSLVFVKSQ